MSRYQESLARSRAFAAEEAAKKAADAMATNVQQMEADARRQEDFVRDRFSQTLSLSQAAIRRAQTQQSAAEANLDGALRSPQVMASSDTISAKERARDELLRGAALRMDQVIQRDEQRARSQHVYMTQRMADIAAAAEAALDNALAREAAAQAEAERYAQGFGWQHSSSPLSAASSYARGDGRRTWLQRTR